MLMFREVVVLTIERYRIEGMTQFTCQEEGESMPLPLVASLHDMDILLTSHHPFTLHGMI